MSAERVVFACVSESLGGGELYLLHTARAVAERVEAVVAGTPGSPVVEEARRLGIPVEYLRVGQKLSQQTALPDALRYPFARRRLREFLLRGYRAWTVFQYKWEELLWGGHVQPEKVALWEHGPIPEKLLRIPWARRRLRHCFRRAAAVFAWSEPARVAIHDLAGRAPDLLAAGVEPQRARRAIDQRDELRARYGASGERALLVFAGRLSEDKGVFEVLQALPALPRAHMLICGEGPAKARLRTIADHLGVSERTEFLGFVPDPMPYLAAADATMLLTRSPGEGRPLVAVESSAVGTPVLALADSAAMRALAGEGRADLLRDATPNSVREGVAAVLRRERQPVATPTWADTAGLFLATLANKGNRR